MYVCMYVFLYIFNNVQQTYVYQMGEGPVFGIGVLIRLIINDLI